MWHIRSALITILLFAVPHAGYASVTPDVLVETTITELIDQLQAQRPELEKDKLKLFKKLMIRTYATALFEYTGKERMEIKPMRMKDGDQRARVETTVILPSAPAVPVHYSFILTEDGDWKIYDVKIDGISLVTTYRSSYGQAVQSKGLDALINELKEKNNNLETTS